MGCNIAKKADDIHLFYMLSPCDNTLQTRLEGLTLIWARVKQGKLMKSGDG